MEIEKVHPGSYTKGRGFLLETLDKTGFTDISETSLVKSSPSVIVGLHSRSLVDRSSGKIKWEALQYLGRGLGLTCMVLLLLALEYVKCVIKVS